MPGTQYAYLYDYTEWLLLYHSKVILIEILILSRCPINIDFTINTPKIQNIYECIVNVFVSNFFQESETHKRNELLGFDTFILAIELKN